MSTAPGHSFHLAVLDATPSEAPPSHLTDQLIAQDAAVGIELLGHDDFTDNDAAGVLRVLQPGPSRRHWMVVALDRLPREAQPSDEASAGLPLVPGRGEVEPDVRLLGSAHVGLALQENTDRLDLDLAATEGTWNLGVGFVAVVAADRAEQTASALTRSGIATWQIGVVEDGERPEGDYEQGAKGVDGGAVRLVGSFAEGAQ